VNQEFVAVYFCKTGIIRTTLITHSKDPAKKGAPGK
jgi:hypothetical protein